MANNNGKKPGVYLYFKPMLSQAEKLTNEQLGELVRAILRYACPDLREEPHFKDPYLDKAWDLFQDKVDQDDDRYDRRRISQAYARFCRSYKEVRGVEKCPISYERWQETGCLKFAEFEGSIYDPLSPLYVAGATNNVAGATNNVEGATNNVEGATNNVEVRTNNDAGATNNAGTSNTNTSTDTSTKTNSSSKTDTEAKRESKYNVTAKTRPPAPGFVPPTQQEVRDFFWDNDFNSDPDVFFHYYAERDWQGVRHWEAKANLWEAREKERGGNNREAPRIAPPLPLNEKVSADELKEIYANAIKEK